MLQFLADLLFAWKYIPRPAAARLLYAWRSAQRMRNQRNFLR